MARGWELWPVGERRQRCGRLGREEGGVWCEWPGAESCGQSERQGRGPGGFVLMPYTDLGKYSIFFEN